MSHRRLLALCALACLLAACKRPAGGEAQPAPAAPSPPAAASAPQAPPAGDSVRAGRAPALRIAALDGTQYDLAAHRGKWVVVNFWATWCAPCLKEMPELSALDAMREYVEVIGLAYEDIAPADMRAFLDKHPVAYPVAIVDVYAPPAGFDTPRGLPTTYLVDPDGGIARHFLGPVTAAEIEQAIAAAGGPRPHGAGAAPEAGQEG